MKTPGITNTIRGVKPKKIIYYGDGTPGPHEPVAVFLIMRPEPVLVVTDYSEAGSYVGGKYYDGIRSGKIKGRYLGTAPFHDVITAVSPETPVLFPGNDLAYSHLEAMAKNAGHPLPATTMPIKTVPAHIIKKIHETIKQH